MNTNMPVGVSDFKKVREKYYFVDKTDFICRLLDTHTDVTLFTRPRRFGKTLTMSMLDYFFSIDKRKDGNLLFTGLAVEKAGPAYMKHQGQYPVIYMTLKDFYNPTWESMFRSFQLLIQEIYGSFSYLLQSDCILAFEKDGIQRILELKASPEEYLVSIKKLSSLLYKYHGIQPIVLIDEYDAPLQHAYDGNYYEEALIFWKGWFNNTLKDNPSLNFAVLTGVLRIAKESIFSGLNNLAVYSTVEQKYSDVFGFTTTEVKEMTQKLHMEHKLSEIQQWYDGYTFGTTEIYNPWSVIQYVANHCTAAPYWIHTSDNGILQALLHQATPQQMEEIQNLLQGKNVAASLQPNVVYRALHTEPKALYTILLTTGYLTAVADVSQADNRYLLRIPNAEIRRVYRLEILDTLAKNVDSDTYEDLFDYLLAGQADKFATQLQSLLVRFASTYDTAAKESFYHGFMLGMTALFLIKDYEIVSNSESGYGRFDLAIFPLDVTKPGVIMEFEVAPDESTLESKANEGLQQIEQKEYVTAFQKRNIQHVWKYGIAFCGKHVYVAST